MFFFRSSVLVCKTNIYSALNVLTRIVLQGGAIFPTSAAFRSEKALQSLHSLSACVGFFFQIVQFYNNWFSKKKKKEKENEKKQTKNIKIITTEYLSDQKSCLLDFRS